MTAIAFEQAQANLLDLVSQLQPGEEIQILRDDQLVAKLVGQKAKKLAPRRAGSAKDKILFMADDFEE